MARVIWSLRADAPNGCATPKLPEKSRLRREARGRNFDCVRFPMSDKPPILKAYLDTLRREVQRLLSDPRGFPKNLSPRSPEVIRHSNFLQIDFSCDLTRTPIAILRRQIHRSAQMTMRMSPLGPSSSVVLHEGLTCCRRRGPRRPCSSAKRCPGGGHSSAEVEPDDWLLV